MISLARDDRGRCVPTRSVNLEAPRAAAQIRLRARKTTRARNRTAHCTIDQRAKSDVLWMNVFSFEMFTLPKPVVASQPAFAL